MTRATRQPAASTWRALAPVLAVVGLLVTSLLGSWLAPSEAAGGSSHARSGGDGLSVGGVARASFDACESKLRDDTAHLFERDRGDRGESVTARRPRSSPPASDTRRQGSARTPGGERAGLVACFDPALVLEVAARPLAGRRVDPAPGTSEEHDIHAPRGPPSKLFA